MRLVSLLLALVCGLWLQAAGCLPAPCLAAATPAQVCAQESSHGCCCAEPSATSLCGCDEPAPDPAVLPPLLSFELPCLVRVVLVLALCLAATTPLLLAPRADGERVRGPTALGLAAFQIALPPPA